MQLSWELTLLITMRPAPCGSERPDLHDGSDDMGHDSIAVSMQSCSLYMSLCWVHKGLDSNMMGRAC